ncbi:MAG: CCA tRNA nucleotidyltransferase, partial [Planktomarina sp.]
EDAKRRDFTMNALYADRDGTIIDPLGGLDDTTRQRIRFIGDPDDRIREDYLRILRFFRFYGWYGKSKDGIDADGLAACAALADGLDLVSNERVGSELLKLLSAPDPCPAMASMDASGVLLRILPGASAKSLPILHELETDLTPDPLRRLAILGGSNAKDNLRLSKAQAETLQNLTTHAQNTQSSLEMGYALGATRGIDAWIIRCAWLEHMPNQPDLDMIERGACATLPIQAGDITHWYSGRDLGNALKRAQVAWLDSGALMTKDQLIKMLTPG